MTRFLIDANVDQRAIRNVPTEGKGFDVLLPEKGSYKDADDVAVLKIANSQQRVLVSSEKDFGRFQLRPEDVPYGALWLRPPRNSQRKVRKLLAGLCRVLIETFPSDPYNFHGRIVEVSTSHVVIRESGDRTMSYTMPDVSNDEVN